MAKKKVAEEVILEELEKIESVVMEQMNSIDETVVDEGGVLKQLSDYYENNFNTIDWKTQAFLKILLRK